MAKAPSAKENKIVLNDSEEIQGDVLVSDTEEKDKTLIELWKKRFNAGWDFRKPILDRNLRMYKLYRAYRESLNYAYQTSLMPPTGFEIIETVKPRMASASTTVNIYPTKKEDINSPSISKWDDLIEYDLEVIQFDDKKIEWINAQLLFGNGVAQIMWDGGEEGDPDIEIIDPALFVPDPHAEKRLKNSRWEIKATFKDIQVVKSEEEKRGEDALYFPDKLKLVENTSNTFIDPRLERYEINTLKMGQINTGKQKKGDIEPTQGTATPDKSSTEKQSVLYECFDHIEGTLVVIANWDTVIRNEENPYKNIRKGRVFIDLPAISLPWEYNAMAYLEPVETTIHEIADSRNQAADDIIFSLDPIRKVKKGKDYKPSDLVHEPGATWYLDNVNDVTFERLPEVSRSWIERDEMLRREIQTALALSEYSQGIPKSSQEPASKVEILLMQTNIRFSLLVRQMEIAFTDLVNALIEMNQEFLGEEKSFRLVGKEFRWSEFTAQDKKITVDARVDVKPRKEKSPEQESREVFEMYRLFVVDDQPDANDPKSVEFYRQKKRAMQKLILEKAGYEEYQDVLVAGDENEEDPQDKEMQTDTPQIGEGEAGIPTGPGSPVGAIPIQPGPAEGLADNPVAPQLAEPQAFMPAELLPPEPEVDPASFLPQTSPGAPRGLSRLLQMFRGR